MPTTKSKPQSKTLSISDRVREAIAESGLSQSAISESTGVHQSRLCHFVKGSGLNVAAMEKLLDFFGFNIERPER